MADPAAKVEFIKRNFSKLPINQPAFAHKGAAPKGTLTPQEIDQITAECHGNGAEFTKRINERMGRKTAA